MFDSNSKAALLDTFKYRLSTDSSRKFWNKENMPKKKTSYTTVHIPTDLAELIDSMVENGRFAYASRSEFVKDAVRRFLEYHGHYPIGKQDPKMHELYAGTRGRQ